MLIAVTERPLDEQAARAHVSKPGNGAVVVFFGCVRDRHEGREVASVEYHAYGAMAERELSRIAREVAAKHGVADVAVLHRTGRLPVGEASLVVAVGSPHRAAAFRCAEEIIDVLKEQVPIWKKEIGPAGEAWQEGVTPRGPERPGPS
jgi:molybdopterin synthase catalytic subunit